MEQLKDDEKEEAVNKYKQSIVDRGVPKYTMSVFSAHQMGTCRIGSSPVNVCCRRGWRAVGMRQLVRCRCKYSPIRVGANPMVTTLATAHMISNRIALRLQYEDDRLDDVDEDELFHVIQPSGSTG